MRATRMQLYIILHNIRSRQNVGAIFRTADGAGVSKIYLTGYTPRPVDRFGRVDEKILKTALGATESVPWEAFEDINSLIEELKGRQVEVVTLEQAEGAVPYTEWSPKSDVACIVGNEIEGVPEAVSQKSDTVLYIKMHGVKESLNVATAAGILLFHARSRMGD